MSGGDDWKPGDLALCVNDSLPRYRDERYQVRAGGVGVVEGMRLSDQGNLALYIDGFPCTSRLIDGRLRGWAAFRFRKIHPLTDAERDEFLADLDTPVRTPAKA